MSKTETSPTQKMLNIWAIVLIIWSFYRATFKSDLPVWFDEFIAKPLVFLTPIYFFIKKSEEGNFLKGIGFTKKHVLTDIIFGLGVGSLFVVMALLTRVVRGLPFFSFSITSTSLLWVISTITAAAMEQILSTGFVFKRLSEESKGIIRPLVISALLFFFLHVPVLFGADKLSGSMLAQMMILNTVLSLVTSVVFMLRKNIVSPLLVHTLYLLSLPILL
jgi:membrane protease YdiL (CAAX protease family)